MKILIRGGRVIDPASGTDRLADVVIAAGRIIGIGAMPADFAPNRVIDASGCWVLPGVVDLCARLGEPGLEHAGMLESETAAAVAGGVTSLVCPPDTDPVLDEPGLVDMLRSRADKLHRTRLFPLGALTRGLAGEVLAEMVQLTERGCVGFGQAERPIVNTQVLQRAFQYAATFGYTLWLRPCDPWLSQGVMASGPLATRLGLSGMPAAAEVIALHTLLELLRAVCASTPAGQPPMHLHLCRISSAAGVALVRQAKAEGLPVSADVSIHHLMLTDVDVGYFDTRMRLQPPVRQQRDRDALRAALADGTLDAVVSDHTPVSADAKALPFAEAEPGATALELLAAVALKWAQEDGVAPLRWVEVLTAGPARVLGSRLGTLQASVGRLAVGGVADVCVFDPSETWRVQPQHLCSQSRHTPFEGHALPGRVRATLVGGHVAYDAVVAGSAHAA
ncbi:dihydroorotase [Tepidimonas charontis]|uniref:Dihydroorotase n=1 Tax=Tepidimonas charontis TaxID=2267262 RepID=A0A554X1C6_9BURK|nr:dihydroorotase [Tepidimonas charontis]TSE29662.1 Dihydroorotase [Tepidimonas charontis]